MPPDARQYAAATQRNREPILSILKQVLPPSGTVLEISSGTGEHAVFFAPYLQSHQWLPSDPNPMARASIEAWRKECPAPNLHPVIALDASDPVWLVEQPEQLSAIVPDLDLQRCPIMAIANINMMHIAPWSACQGLMAGAGRILPVGGVLYLYGPFKQKGEHTASSNAEFDAYLQAQNSQWGVRDLEQVIAAAQAQNLALQQVFPMPANNLSVVFQTKR
jgi:hypothetical protein